MLQRSFFCVLAVGGILAGCRAPREPAVVRVALTSEPRTWNRMLATDLPTHIVTDQLHAPLIRLNKKTQQMEPALAYAWEFEAGGAALVFHLRSDARFSDGEPATADDVLFSFRCLHDPDVASPLAETAVVDGTPLVPERVDDFTVRFALPRRTASVERIFDSIPILPEHRLAESLDGGTLAAATGLAAPASDVVGLGPFRLIDYRPGESVVMEPNPFYFRGAPANDGETERSVDGLRFEVISDAHVRRMRFEAGELDVLGMVDASTFLALRETRNPGLRLVDLGPGMQTERLWFNLNPDSPIDAGRKRWFQERRFRRAVSLAVDRRAMSKLVFHGLATPARGPVSPASPWQNPRLDPPARDLTRARDLLSEAGFEWGEDGALLDRSGERVAFSVLLVDSEPRRRMLALLQEDLAEIGIEVGAATVDPPELMARITGSFDYESCLLGFTQTDPDPSAEMALWLSRSPLHLWHPRQPEPRTAWEARIDRLMEAQLATLEPEERRAQFHEVQEIVVEQLPLIDLVVPHALVGYRARVQGLEPTPFGHPLWSSEELSLGERVMNPVVPRSSRDIRH